MDRDTIISLSLLPDTRTRATVSGFFCEAHGSLEILTPQSSGTTPEDRITQGLVTKFINIAIMVAGDAESIEGLNINNSRRLAAVG